MNTTFHPFFIQFSQFLTNVEELTNNAKYEITVPLSVKPMYDQEHVFFAKRIEQLQDEVKHLSETVDNTPTVSSMAETTEILLRNSYLQLEQLRTALSSFVLS